MIFFLLLFALVALIFFVIKNHIHIKFNTFVKKGFQKIDNKFGVHCYCGKQGTGKTYSAVDFCNRFVKLGYFVVTNLVSYSNFLGKEQCLYEPDILKIMKKLETLRKSYRNHVNNKKFINNNHVRLFRITYDELVKIWEDEFIKLLKLPVNEEKRKVLGNREDVKNYLEDIYFKKPGKANRLYAFYIQLKLEGYDKVKDCYSSSTFYRNISELKDLGINWTSTEFEILEVKNENYYYFNPFLMKEVV